MFDALPDVEFDGEAFVGGVAADFVFEEAEVGFVQQDAVVHEEDDVGGHDRARLLFAGESGVEEFETFAADVGWGSAGDGFLEDAVERAGAEAVLAGFFDAFDGSKDFI